MYTEIYSYEELRNDSSATCVIKGWSRCGKTDTTIRELGETRIKESL